MSIPMHEVKLTQIGATTNVNTGSGSLPENIQYSNGELKVDSKPVLLRDNTLNMVANAPLVWDSANNRAISGSYNTVRMDVTYDDNSTDTFHLCIADGPMPYTVPMEVTYEDGTTEIFHVLAKN